MQGTRGLFVPGPTNVPEAIRKALDVPMEDHRSPDVPGLVLPLFQDLKKVFRTETGQVFLFPATGTGGWEASITNTLSPGDKVLAPRFGQFSLLWVDLCQRMGLDVEVLECDWGTGVPLDAVAARLEADKKHEIKAILACHNETATGVTSDIGGLRRVMDAADHPAMLYVDGISSIGSLEFHMEDWGVDLAVAGSQKGFMMPAGLALIGVSQKALEASKTAGLRRCYFDFKDMIATNATGYFPYTPPMHMLHGLRASLNRIEAEGLENIWARHRFLAEGVRRAISAWNMTLCAREPKWYSDTVSAIVVPEGHDARKVIARAYERYGLSLGAGLSVVAGKVFRIGHLGDLNELMLMSALGITEMAMRDSGLPVEAGAGVAAAGEFWRQSNSRSMALAAE
ncbi:aminotransferase class V-fold PLP-dependent enzyme [Pseudogemmobacter faecipullorum]|uniref:Aminotransferase class V-fold PLP-dependent enzyme n=1 Tax=Pseudogemmobacter faecipullorum TaxID=2755041 RepID=A0ABS8CPQ4_9RHOB|nr:aminotransferase class V-fold PLP-dependent enzyme [Pseudogemmobacter faecipullorum]MCB5411381.1 aminotransferase class V-fold PLP-dependent enzyme [Pseudogemmobacter faecipullorum]